MSVPSLIEAYKVMHGWCTPEKAACLIDLVHEFKPVVTVEIGVFGGKSLIALALGVKQLAGDGVKRLVYGIDPWDRAASTEGGLNKPDKDWWGSFDHEDIRKSCQEWIKRLGVEDVIEICRCRSVEIRTRFREREIGLLHVDGNHSPYSSCLDLLHYLPLMKPGGIVVMDDIDWATTSVAVGMLEIFCERLHTDKQWRVYRLVKRLW